MRAIASVAFGIAATIGGCLVAASVASVVMADSRAHSFANISGPDLWTSAPVKVDRTAQDYERLPPVLSTYAANPPKITVASQAPVAAASPVQAGPALSPEHLSWCAGQYRSFNPETNSYRAFSGESRACVSPFDTTGSAVATSENVQPGPAAAAPAIASWCAARYQSYRAEDNTYQPYDGPRRVCEGPRGGDQFASTL